MKNVEYETGVEIDRLLKSAEAGLSHTLASYEQALKLCQEAWSLVPEPKMGYLQSLTVLANLMHHYLRRRDFDRAMETIKQIETVPDFARNEFVRFCKGEILVEKKLVEEAHSILKELLQQVGESIFVGQNPTLLYVAKFGKLPTRRYYPHRKKHDDEVWLPPVPNDTDSKS
jgi:tetratricopeptide (TPR) repeat protein